MDSNIELRKIKNTGDHNYDNDAFIGSQKNLQHQPNWILQKPDQNGTGTQRAPHEDTSVTKSKMDLDDDAEKPLSTRIQMEHDNPDDKVEPPRIIAAVLSVQDSMGTFCTRNKSTITSFYCVLFAMAYAAYFAYAMYYNLEGEDSIRLLWITCTVVFFMICKLISETCGQSIYNSCISPIVHFIEARFAFFKWLFIAVIIITYVSYIVIEVAIKYPENLISLMGYFIYVILFFFFSASPAKVQWRPVLWGLGIQLFMGFLVLKTSFGYDAFKWLGDRVSEFLKHTDAGAIFVFGETYLDHFFAFSVLPVVIFFSTIVSVLYYLGVMQFVILRIAWVMQKTLGTTVAESVNAAGNIFIGQTEAPLLIRPMINDMTTSEIHAVMVGGFATIAGSVMATYILFGVSANHLICASVMAAPCALAMSKLSYPETGKSKLSAQEKDIGSIMEAAPHRNVIEAASAGASASIKLVANIGACLIAFIALLAFVDATLAWFGDRVGLSPPDYQQLSFPFICSYLLWPLAYIMGVATDDCRQVAELIGYKTFTNEFIAYDRLGDLINNTDTFNAYNGSWIIINDDIYLEDSNVTLYGGVMQDRSIVISTYALCGFANLSSMGMVIGALSSMAPSKKSDISGIAFRSMITGTVVSFMNACTAGLLYDGTTR